MVYVSVIMNIVIINTPVAKYFKYVRILTFTKIIKYNYNILIIYIHAEILFKFAYTTYNMTLVHHKHE